MNGRLPYMSFYNRRNPMLPFDDPTILLKEKRSERLEQRVKPTVKKTIETAAALLGITVAGFVLSHIYREARKVIEDHRRLSLTQEDFESLMAALDRTSEPTDEFRAMAETHKKIVA